MNKGKSAVKKGTESNPFGNVSNQILKAIEKLLNEYDKVNPIWRDEAVPREKLVNYLNDLSPIGKSFEMFVTNCITGCINKKPAPNGSPYKYHSHQWILQCFPGVIEELAPKLINCLKYNEELHNYDFEKLFELIRDKKVEGFGALCIYDFCLRFGWHQKNA